MSILSVLSPAPIAPTPGTAEKIQHATDHFIRDRLPEWLRKATPAQINLLRDLFAAHHMAQHRVQERLAALTPIDRFAETHVSAAVAAHLSESAALADLEWCEVRRAFRPPLGIGLPTDTLTVLRQPALLRLMQNFHESATFYAGTGLVRKGEDRILSGDADACAAAVRALDLGAQYQAHLSAFFTSEAQHALAEDKRAAFALCVQMALLQGRLTGDEAAALQRLTGAPTPVDEHAVTAYPGAFTVLGASIEDALAIQLRGAEGAHHGVVLYVPTETDQPLRRFTSWETMNAALAASLKAPAYRRRFSQGVELAQRAEFLERLTVRLTDQYSDLELAGPTVGGSLFDHLAAQQVQRVKADAAVLLVSSADADSVAAKARLDRWDTLGLDLLNLAGLFVPAIGAVLLAQLVVQTASDVYEGIAHWRRGHRHEALQHLLGVAETVAITAATAVGVGVIARGFTRSAFVDALEPVCTSQGRRLLWHRDLEPFIEQPDNAALQDDGRFSNGARDWIRLEGRFYRIHQPESGGRWRLRHPRGEGAFEPVVEFDGERSWRLRDHCPLEWSDTANLLDTLWPHDPPLTPERARRILRIAAMDEDELRGLLVEHRHAPCNLKWAIHGVAADQRIEAFYADVARAELPGDAELWHWCRTHPALAQLEVAGLRDALIEEQGWIRLRLFDYLMAGEPASDPLHALVERDFPGLPRVYVQAVLEGATEAERTVAVAERRLPLRWATRARGLLQLARLNKALAGLYLHNTYAQGTGELVLALLRRVRWPRRLNLELRDGRDGILLARLDPSTTVETPWVMVHEDDGVHLYDQRGLAHEQSVAPPRTIFQVLVALLTPQELAALDCHGPTAAEDLRQRLLEHLPADPASCRRLAGWPAEPGWFNPGQRLPDGRVGYPLSGRGSGENSAQLLRGRVRRLYWGFTDQQVESYLNMLMRSPGSAFDLLLNQELNYQYFDDALNAWAARPSHFRLRSLRHRMTDALRRCWRLQGSTVFAANGQVEGMLLDLSEYPVGTLPSLPERTDLGHVTQLTLRFMDLTEVPDSFLQAFMALQHVDLSENRLTQVPAGIARLTTLRSVRLSNNRIVYSEPLADRLYGLLHLRLLDLSYNPLGRFAWRYNSRGRLSTLLLAHAQLREWPTGLLECTQLEYVDLRSNRIHALPPGLLDAPLNYRRAFVADDNPLARWDLSRLAARDPAAASPDWGTVDDTGNAHAPWSSDLPANDQAQRIALWNRVSDSSNASGFITLLGELTHSADYRQARTALQSQVWQLLERIDADGELREEVFTRASEPRTCADCAADQFAELRLQVMVFDAHRATGPQREQTLLNLARRLFRLDRLDQFIRADIAARIAAGRGVDEVEVSLAYRVRLAQELDLPAQPAHMLFEQVASVTLVQLDDALEAVRTAERSWELADNVSRRSFWRAYLEASHPDAFAAIREAFAARGSALDDLASTLTSEQYHERWRTLESERAAAFQAVAFQLTEEALARHPQH
ncbi:NEL-type E3 ubiquitin ligase domain-containing protein [Pseudomonas entomophila]|uniref:NEL-type E3 ubiquitin ligase domain-containing protein n=1 Tax=Pseudomonas entomophila TaxID=312306 RepID=UPI003EB6AF42